MYTSSSELRILYSLIQPAKLPHTYLSLSAVSRHSKGCLRRKKPCMCQQLSANDKPCIEGSCGWLVYAVYICLSIYIYIYMLYIYACLYIKYAVCIICLSLYICCIYMLVYIYNMLYIYACLYVRICCIYVRFWKPAHSLESKHCTWCSMHP